MGSRHSRFARCPNGFFRGLSSFADLEARIAALPEELDRGNAFEIFVEAYLATTAVWQVGDLWLVGQVPLEVRQKLNLPADAKGIDGVFRTRSGTCVPYQVKHRVGRPRIGVTEVATFLGLTDRATDRVLISNCDRYSPDVEMRDHLRLLRGTDFDALTSDELTAIADWLEARPVTRSPNLPLPHQKQALADIEAALSKGDRATVVMACGTGKTLVGLWAAEQQSPKSVLVLVPSLALLSQALGDWSRDTSWGERFEYLCVCSDPSVSAEQDALKVRPTDLPFRVDTDPEVVRRFVARSNSNTVRVVFSTYHSSAVVAQAVRGLPPFDLGIFDEAHKTTGARGATFALALDDARLPIRKRLFFTATPRHFDIRHRDKEGDFRLVSMDDAELYGVRAHTLSFADGVTAGLICDYRVVVSVVDPVEVSAFALRHGITLVAGDQQATQWVANQVAVSKAIETTGAQRVITFHNRVSQAQDFASDTARGIGQYLDDFVVDHVNGELRVAERRDILSGLKDQRRRLITNARCLTEGVDLPAVDMIAFCNPRKSRIDIIQAVGRAMRKSRDGGKSVGYVVVPMLLAPNQGNDLEEVARNTDWEDVVDVLAALREHDTRLDDLIRDARVTRGEGKTFDPRSFMERVQILGSVVTLDSLRQHIGALIVDRLGATWDERYGQLLAFREQYGHCNVDFNYHDKLLYSWVSNQRDRYAKRKISAARVLRLNEIGFVWHFPNSVWEQRYQDLVAFRNANGHCMVPREYPQNPDLSHWARGQLNQRRLGSLSQERRERLDALGFVWDQVSEKWEQRFQELVAFTKRYGHCNVPQHYFENPALGSWLSCRRRDKRNGRLSTEREGRLAALGVVWNTKDATWEERLQQLIDLKSRDGHCEPPTTSSLGRWLSEQRGAHRRGRLPALLAARLEGLGVDWTPFDTGWEQRYRELVAFRDQHGHCYVNTDSSALGRWLGGQRRAYRQGKLANDRASRLSAAGVNWEPKESRWEAQFQALVAFKAQHGHCDLSAVDPNQPKLGKWMSVQRQMKKAGTASKDRIDRLTQLGVVWNLGAPHKKDDDDQE